MLWYNAISHNSSYYLKMLYVTEISKFPSCQLHCNQIFNHAI